MREIDDYGKTKEHNHTRKSGYIRMEKKWETILQTVQFKGKAQKLVLHYSYYFDRQLMKLDHIIKGQHNTTQHNTGKDKDEVDR